MTSTSCASALKTGILAVIMVFLFPMALPAAGAPMPKGDFDFSEAAVKRGEQLFTSTCQSCHSLKYLGYEARITAENAQNAFGKAPPDLSLMTKARSGGAGYISALLAGYNDSPEKNSVFPNIAMPPPFSGDDSEFTRKAKDVSAFLLYAADPSANERRGLGRYVLGYMVVLTTLLFFFNRKTWKGIRKKPPDGE
jgi:cytochrome c1